MQQAVLAAAAELKEQRVERHGVALQLLRRFFAHGVEFFPLPPLIEHRKAVFGFIPGNVPGDVHALGKASQQLVIHRVDPASQFVHVHGFLPLSEQRISYSTTAAAASTQGTARGTMQGSCRPAISIVVSRMAARSTVRCRRAMDGVGLNAARNTSGAPVVMPPRIPPQRFVSVIALPAAQHKGVVILAAAQRGGGEPRAELHALHSGNTEERRGKTALHAVKKRVAEPCGQTEHRALHHAADTVAVGACPLQWQRASPRRALR